MHQTAHHAGQTWFPKLFTSRPRPYYKAAGGGSETRSTLRPGGIAGGGGPLPSKKNSWSDLDLDLDLYCGELALVLLVPRLAGQTVRVKSPCSGCWGRGAPARPLYGLTAGWEVSDVERQGKVKSWEIHRWVVALAGLIRIACCSVRTLGVVQHMRNRPDWDTCRSRPDTRRRLLPDGMCVIENPHG